MSSTEENAVEAHSLGRHVSTHPEDKAFWEKACPVCATVARLQPWMIAGAAAIMRGLTDEQLAVEANLPIDGMTPGEMLDRVVAQREIDRRAGQ